MSRGVTFVRAACVALALLAGPLAAEDAAVLPAPPKVVFKSHYLVDFTTDRVLAADAADAQLPPASLTKLMTAYVVFDALQSGESGSTTRCTSASGRGAWAALGCSSR